MMVECFCTGACQRLGYCPNGGGSWPWRSPGEPHPGGIAPPHDLPEDLFKEKKEKSKRGVPHRCPKCSGRGWLNFDPATGGSGGTQSLYRCNKCDDGIIWAR